MLSVALGPDDFDLPPQVSIAAVNAPCSVVVSGPTEAVNGLAERLAQRKVATRPLRVSHAFHSSMVDPIVDAFEAAVRGVERSAPAAPFVSNVTGTWIAPSEATNPAYWAAHLRKPVLFAKGLDALMGGIPGRASGWPSVVELGAGTGLMAPLKQAYAKEARAAVSSPACVASLPHPSEGSEDDSLWLRAVGRLFVAGHAIDFRALHPGELPRRIPLPGYAFERRRYWLDPVDRQNGAVAVHSAAPVYERPQSPNAVEPPRTDLERSLAEMWRDLLGIDPIGVHDDFFSLGGQSLLAAELVSRIAAATGQQLRVRDLYEAPTIARLSARIAGESQGPQVSAPSAAILADIALDEDIAPASPAGPAAPETIVVTGATGFLGAFVTHELLSRSRARVVCIVRAADEGAARERLRAAFARYGLPSERLEDRVELACGDLASARLGLDGRTYAALADRVDSVIHLGARVDFLHSYASLREANVVGTQRVLRFAATGRTKPLHLVSTAAIFSAPEYEALPVREDDAAVHGASLESGYQQSKWVADRIAALAMGRGMPVAIHRPATVGGHSVTGAWNRADYLLNMLLASTQMGLAPDGDFAVHFAPVDDVAAAVATLALRSDSTGRAFHLVAPTPLRMSAVLELVRSLGYPIDVVPYARWRQEVVAASGMPSRSALKAFLSVVPESLRLTDLALDTTNAVTALRDTGIACRPLGRAVLHTFFQRCFREGLLSRAPR
jgi:thioester reductase-like protein